MGNLLSTTVLGALLMFAPNSARQTASFEVKIQPQDIQKVQSYAQNLANSNYFVEEAEHIEPVEVAIEPNEEQIVSKQPQIATSTYVMPKPTPTNTSKPVVGPVELEILVDMYAGTYGVRKDIMMIIMKCESGFNPSATNGSFGGLFQFMSSTWISNRKAMGLDPNPQLRFNAEEAIRTAAFKMGRDGYGAWPACSTKAFGQLAIN